jgi:ribonuclease PH
MSRNDLRQTDQLRKCKIERHYLKDVPGSVLISMGDTKVLCTVTIEKGVPRFMRDSKEGWLTAEYGMLPRSTPQRNDREAAKGKQKGRTVEIQRLIGRSLRQMIDFKQLGQVTIKIDCDVIQADGGTRTAAITGATVALIDAITHRYPDKANTILRSTIAAVSVGIYQGEAVLDLNYIEDCDAGTDMNVIMDNKLGIIEVQGTAEQAAFSREQFNQMLDLAQGGIEQLLEMQQQALAG